MQHWVFDLDGTLVDSFDFFLDFAKIEFAKADIEFTRDHRTESLGTPALRFLKKYLGEKSGESALQKLREQSFHDSKQIRPFPGIIEHLENLHSQNRKMAVWTSRDRMTTEQVLEHSGLGRFMCAVVTGCCVKSHKPHPEGIETILKAFECAPKDITMIGDHDVDVRAAKASGVRALRAAWHRHEPTVTCSIADAVIVNVDDLTQWY